MLITLLEEGDSTMNPSYSILNTANSQNLFRATQILFGKKCVRSYLILRTNSEKKVKIEMRREGKEVAFQNGTYS